MKRQIRRGLFAAAAALAIAGPTTAQTAYDCRLVMIPMRDGVHLRTIVVTPAGAARPLPLLMIRTPYGAGNCPQRRYALDAGYLSVFQDIRGRSGSEGQFVMNRPNRTPDVRRPARDASDAPPAGSEPASSATAPGDSAATDESTDTWDTVEWLIHNVPGNNGRVGIVGISYPGWLAEEPLIGPHPAVRAVSPQAPMTDTWMGDDFFHQGAFRQSYGFEYGWGMEAGMVGAGPLPITGADTYDWYLSFPSLEALTDSTGAIRIPTWRRFVEHPEYDSVWQRRAFERVVRQLSVPTLLVGGFWDQEDLFGPQATYAALERTDSAQLNHLVIGPWSHGQWGSSGGERLGNLDWGQATSDTFLLRIQAPWFAYWLKGEGDGRFPKARLFDGGTDAWRSFDAWPPPDAVAKALYVRADGALSFDASADTDGYDQYVSDPADPVPYRPRPVEITYSRGSRWARWMTEDQRFVDGRPDVLTWRTAPLAQDVTIAGEVVAHLFAATTGSDADWVVKLIDVYPDTLPAQPAMGGYELMVAGDIMRGRYRQSWERAAAIPSGAVEPYTVDLHYQFYTFKRGHRIMVQVQSTWFPLYDRNPQTFVPNIFLAPASAYKAATERIYRTAAAPSHVEVMVLPAR